MGISNEEAREWARKLIERRNEEFDYSDVYEDEDVNEAFPDDADAWETIYDQMYEANITVTWED